MTWTSEGPANFYYTAIACSPDDTHLLLSGYDYSTSEYEVWISSNTGASWTQLADSDFNAVVWPTSTELLASGAENGTTGTFVSSDAGSTWTQLSSDAFDALAASSDGVQIYASGNSSGPLMSSNSGTTWSVMNSIQWSSGATSPDGSTVIVSEYGGPPAVSTDSGQSWTLLASGVAVGGAFVVSSDDQHIIAADTATPIKELSEVTSAGTAGYLAGNQAQSVTLQYFGNGLFTVIDNEGQLTVQ